MSNKIKEELTAIKQLLLLGTKNVLNMDDASLLTGFSKSHLYKLVCAKKIPHFKSKGGKITYFKKDELETWMLNHRVATHEEIEQQAANYSITRKKG